MTVMVEKKFKAHQVYKLADGSRVPGVTTITGELGWSKDVLCKWGNKMGLAGIDTTKYVDDKAAIGTLAHAMITNELIGETTDTDEYSKKQIEQAENSYLSFCEWRKNKNIKVILVERQMVSEQHRFGGCMDILAEVDNVLEIIDLKTGSGIYDEHLVQVGGGYFILAEENGFNPQRARILNIPRSEDESFAEKIVPNIEACKRIFLRSIGNYQDHKVLRKEF
jgi:hypothetical protein